jgi:ATP-dependent DNA helicase RecG
MTQTELETIIQGGEGYKIEFKRSVNSDLAREIVAFANSSGGRIFIGIEDDGTVSGAVLDNSLRSRIETTANDCDPGIKVVMETVGNVIVITVPEGSAKPYRCTNGFYIRNGATTLKLNTQDIIEFIKTEGRVKFDELLVTDLDYATQLDDDAVKNYLSLSGITPVSNTDELLINLGVVVQTPSYVLNNTGALFFAKHPASVCPHATVVCVAYKGNQKVDILDKKEFSFNLIQNIDESISFLKRHLNLSFEISGKKRKETLEIPEVVLREAVVNAVAHRDYFEKGANAMIEVFDNRVEITNPGGLTKGLKPEQFGTKTLARNPLIAALLNRAGYIEKLGTGIPRIKKEMLAAELPEAQFEFDGFFTVKLPRFSFETALARDLEVTAKKSARLAHLLRLFNIELFSVSIAASNLDTSERTIRNDLETLVEIGWLKSTGATKGKDYELTETGRQKLARYL